MAAQQNLSLAQGSRHQYPQRCDVGHDRGTWYASMVGGENTSQYFREYSFDKNAILIFSEASEYII